MNTMVHEFGFIRYMHISVSVSILSEVRSIKSLDLLTNHNYTGMPFNLSFSGVCGECNRESNP